MARVLALIPLALLLALAPAAQAREGSWCQKDAAIGTAERWTCQWGPIDVAGYEVRQDIATAPKPPIDGAITHMDVDVTDANGTPVPIRRLMLHHIVFINLGPALGSRHDRTCDAFTMWDSRSKVPALGERFYAAGEERATLDLPPGYGYPTTKAGGWMMTWMVMNHRQAPDRAYVRYHVTVDTAPDLAPVVPYWLDVANCNADPVYDVAGGGAPGSIDARSATFTVPEAGRIVAAGGHVHGGARDLVVSEPDCGGRTLYRSEPAWGLSGDPFYKVRPILHEPGPIAMSAFASQQGIPIAAGERVTLTANYDARRPHTRVMGISMAYVAPDAGVTEPCGPLPGDALDGRTTRPHRTLAPTFTVPLTGLDGRGRARTIARPPGRTVRLRTSANVTVGDAGFRTPNVSVPSGAMLRWRFPSRLLLHNVTVASGPRGFSSPNLDRGRSYAQRLTVRGTYRLFCALHPVAMTATVTVR